ncbi:DUF6249 domain-containing protein [Spirosoma pollinicola]|uniref:DUF6249 domain-containing protein n=1 Tax=Spirosoma pollinicola TaxID=2057025 RepID=A0A2K8Z057_9BACT|nr:DUF6249 domain-containing protein [Spirosoma pollinicola]AUD03239.1 hypothetical protein CWM47_16185 [Spirosoma pollinicola]
MSGDDLKHILIFLGAFASIFGIVYVFLMTRSRERMAMIERGVDASIFSGNGSISPTLKFGMLFVGIAIGMIVADVVANVMYTYYGFSKGISFPAMIFLFGGISLILNFVIERKLSKKK